MAPRESSQGISEFIEEEDVQPVDLNIVSIILESLVDTDALMDDDVVIAVDSSPLVYNITA